MYVEVSVAVNYLLSHLYTKLPRRRVDNFGEELEKCLIRKLQPSWFIESPDQESTHRCFQTSGPHTDFIFLEAAISSGLEWSEIQACLPTGLVLTIDPGHVTCQYGSNDTSPPIPNSVWNSGNGCSSSSGCSSASSVSSSNGSGSWPKTKHQVLYSVNSKNGAGFNMKGEKDVEIPVSEASKKQLDDVQTHLATEAALSVLTEPDDGQITSTPDSKKASGDSLEVQEKTVLIGGKKEKSGDSSFFDHSGTTDSSQAKSDIENQFPFNDFHSKALRHAEELGGDFPHFESQASQANAIPPFTQTAPSTYVQKSTSTPSFTAATFAATKFGSTKLKNQTKRPHRLVSSCEPPGSGYASQLLEVIGQNSIPSNQIPLSDRLMRLSEIQRNGGGMYGGHNFGMDSSRNGVFGNYHSLDRSNDGLFNNSNGISNGFVENGSGVSLYGNSEGPSIYGMRSNYIMNNPMWSQFEKIRSEFQLKNSQYLQQQQSAQENPSLLNRNLGFPFNNIEGSGNSSRNSGSFSTAPRSALQQSEGKFGFRDDLGTNQDLYDLWNSQKFNSNSSNNFCWSNDINKPSMDSSLGQAFNALNISER